MRLSDDEQMCYVAADPLQPGAAWGAAVDLPDCKKDTQKFVRDWMKQGANIERVSVTKAREMLSAWVRPEKKSKQGKLL